MFKCVYFTWFSFCDLLDFLSLTFALLAILIDCSGGRRLAEVNARYLTFTALNSKQLFHLYRQLIFMN